MSSVKYALSQIQKACFEVFLGKVKHGITWFFKYLQKLSIDALSKHEQYSAQVMTHRNLKSVVFKYMTIFMTAATLSVNNEILSWFVIENSDNECILNELYCHTFI